jgi:Mrp family chromosome partitioning ATPase
MAAAQSGPAIDEQVKEKLKDVKNIILILSGKGGVGKSTIASQIALGLSKKENLQIGLLDVDICGPSIPRMMGIENEEIKESPQGMVPVYKEQNLAIMSIGYLIKDKKTAVIWRGPRKNGLIKEFFCNTNWDKLDYLIIDTPPGTSDEHLTLVQYLKSSNLKGAIIVTTPQEISLLDVRKEFNFCQKTNVKVLGVVENMAGFICPHCNKKTEIFEANTGGGEGLCKEFNSNLIGRLPLEPKILQSTEKGNYFPDSFPGTETAKEFEKIVDNVLKF